KKLLMVPLLGSGAVSVSVTGSVTGSVCASVSREYVKLTSFSSTISLIRSSVLYSISIGASLDVANDSCILFGGSMAALLLEKRAKKLPLFPKGFDSEVVVVVVLASS
ncbi:hypothetical protein WICPIJ_008267, partial [Wickerhamomyces pijperi]